MSETLAGDEIVKIYGKILFIDIGDSRFCDRLSPLF